LGFGEFVKVETAFDAFEAFVLAIKPTIDSDNRLFASSHSSLQFLDVEFHFRQIAMNPSQKFVHQFICNFGHQELRRRQAIATL